MVMPYSAFLPAARSECSASFYVVVVGAAVVTVPVVISFCPALWLCSLYKLCFVGIVNAASPLS